MIQVTYFLIMLRYKMMKLYLQEIFLLIRKVFLSNRANFFCNVLKIADKDDNLNVTLDTIFKNIESSAIGTESEPDFKGLFDDIDVNSNKLGGTVSERNKKLVKLLNGIAEMKLGNYKDNTIDAFGDAYEFLMGMYASNAGKSGGEYYTPYRGYGRRIRK